MVAIEAVFSKKNIEAALEHYESKNHAEDKKKDSAMRNIWELNRERVVAEAFQCTYEPELVKEYEIVNPNGKKRVIAQYSELDKLLTRLLSQKLNEFYNPRFHENSYAYQPGKGVLKAVERAKEYVESGKEFVVEIDLKGYFDNIPLERLLKMIAEENKDKRVLALIRSFLYCNVSNGEEIHRNTLGLIQGCTMSPVLSNLYLHTLDEWMHEKGYAFIRYADDINVYVDDKERALEIYQELFEKIVHEYELPINASKSGVYSVFTRRILGYDFVKKGKHIKAQRHVYQKSESYKNWHYSCVQRVNREYHIVQHGILNKKDYALLFENAEEKHHIPVEATEQIDLYNEVVITSKVLSTLANENVRLGLYNKYGNVLGYFVPESYVQDTKTLLKQCELYQNNKWRVQIAKKFEIASVHNMRVNVRYYCKQKKGKLTDIIQYLTDEIKIINECSTVEQMLLEEARCRQQYYQAFCFFIKNEAYIFEKRTKRPPMDRINAMISFGNTLLYNRIQQFIWKTSLDSRIGIVHAANRRHYSLNLDFADLFKPIIIDRVIFTLINKGIVQDDCFITNRDQSVYLSETGKCIFIEHFQDKMYSKLKVGDKTYTYNQLLEKEVRDFQAYIREDKTYQPYKYY